MIYKTHISFALAIGLAPVAILDKLDITHFKTELLMVYMASISFGAIFPDIDEPNSKIGKKFIGVSNLIHGIFGHRGATHFLIVPLLLFIIFFLFHPKEPILFTTELGFIIGYFLHIIGDSLTKSGISNGFFPLFKGKIFALLPKNLRFYTNGAIENLIVMPITTLILVLELYIMFGNGVNISHLLKV